MHVMVVGMGGVSDCRSATSSEMEIQYLSSPAYAAWSTVRWQGAERLSPLCPAHCLAASVDAATQPARVSTAWQPTLGATITQHCTTKVQLVQLWPTGCSCHQAFHHRKPELVLDACSTAQRIVSAMYCAGYCADCCTTHVELLHVGQDGERVQQRTSASPAESRW